MGKNHLFWLKNGLFLAFLVAFDQITKYFAKAHIKREKSYTLIPKIISFKYLNGGNTGAAWGILSGRVILFIIFTVFAIIVISKFIYNIYSMYKINYSLNPKVKILDTLMIVLVAGAIGNLIDRIVNGYVVDFISFDFIRFPIFNVADCYITVSCILLFIMCIFKVDNDTFSNVFTFKKVSNNK
ncbi:MAG: signal peptidase II [Eubacterium sp.]|nr:signal peptidase II [Eubacterium sp.]